MDNNTGDTQLKQQLVESGHGAFDAADYMRALDFYHRASLLDTRDPAVWTSLGLTFNNLDFTREAWRSYVLALGIDPRNTNALWYASEFLFQIEDLPLADLFLGHYLALEEDEEKLAEAHELRAEIRAEAQARGIRIDVERSAEAETMLEGSSEAVDGEQLAEGVAGDSGPEDAEDEDWRMSEEELEQQALQDGKFVPPLSLRLSGFEGQCQHCSLQIPYDAPYCWSCKMVHFYE